MSVPESSYIWVAAAAFVASSGDLGNRYKRSPFIRSTFAVWWLLIAVLDAIAGVLVLLALIAFHYPERNPWILSVAGLLLVGFSATLIVRANLTNLQVGKALIPIGPGVAYGALRSLIEPLLSDRDWELTDAESDGRKKWILDKVDAKRDSLTFEMTTSKVRAYVQHKFDSANGATRMTELNTEIEAALRNPEEIDQIKQLVTFMSQKHYTTPLYRLLDRPNRSTVRSWRAGV